MAPGHILQSYDAELQELRLIISKMGGLAENQLLDSVKALHSHDRARAERVRDRDLLLDKLEKDAERTTIVLFARRAPVADDLREIISSLKMTSHLERIGDYAKNIARRTVSLAGASMPDTPATLMKMADEAVNLIRSVMDAYAQQDAEAAAQVWSRDRNLDNLHNAAYLQILDLMRENPDKIENLTHLLMIAKNLERIGDKTTNIAEQIYYALTGHNIGDDRGQVRPKNDLTSESSSLSPSDDDLPEGDRS